MSQHPPVSSNSNDAEDDDEAPQLVLACPEPPPAVSPAAAAPISSLSLFSVTPPSMQPSAMNDLLVRMRRPLRAGLVQLSREMLRRMKRLRAKRGSEAEVARNGDRADRLLAQVRLLRKWSPQSLCKSLLGHETPLAEALATPGVPSDRLALARLADTRPVRDFVAEFRGKHADWRDLVFYMQYKNTGGRWKRKKPLKPRAPGDLLAGSVEAMARTAPAGSDDLDDDGSSGDDGDEEEAERRRRLDSVLREFRMEVAKDAASVAKVAEPAAVEIAENWVTKIAEPVAKTTKAVVKECKSVAKDAKSEDNIVKSVTKAAKSVTNDAKSVAKDAPLTKLGAKLVAKDAKSVVKNARLTKLGAKLVAKDAKLVAKDAKLVAKARKEKKKVSPEDQAAVEPAGAEAPDDGWSDLFATDVPPTEMKRGLVRGRRITTDGVGSAPAQAPKHGDRQSRKRQRLQLEQQRREKQAAMEADQLHPSWKAKRQLKAKMADAASQGRAAHVVFDDD